MSSHPTQAVLLRRAIADDVPAILEIEQSSFVHAGERFGGRHVRYLINSPRAISMVAEVEGRIGGWAVGFAWLRGKEPWGRVYGLAVRPDARGKKVGQQLLNLLIRMLRDNGANSIFLEVRPDNRQAISLYEKLGFTSCRRLENFYGPGLPAQRMVLARQTRI